jgi:hypothetical protein
VLIDSPQLPNGTTQVTITTDLTGIGPGDPDVLGYIIFTESPPDAQVSVSISNAIQLSIKNPGGSINNAPTQPKDQPTEKIQTLTPEITPVPVSSHEQGIYGLSIGLITGIILVLGGIFLSVGVIWKYILH